MAFTNFPKQLPGVQLLQRSLARGRLGHAYLFTGDRLEELESFARTLAKTLNCQDPVRTGGVATDCCDECLSCRKIDGDSHADIHWARPESKSRVITIDQTRALMREIQLKPCLLYTSRKSDLELVRAALKRSRVVALLGPRQSGKTTLARQFVSADSLNYFDLEDPQSLARLSEPDTALRPLKRLVVIDEVQRRPDLFPLLRVLADRKPLPARFLILGSASPDLLKQSSETLAGRLETVSLEGFRLTDLGAAAQARHWVRGGFPLSYTCLLYTSHETQSEPGGRHGSNGRHRQVARCLNHWC